MQRVLGIIYLTAALVLPAAITNASSEPSYPTKPVRVVVGFGAGGPTDLPARFLAERLTTALGQNYFVENRPGAAGMLAARHVVGEAADGYNLLLCTHQDVVNTALYNDSGYQLQNLAPISLISKYYFGLVASKSLPSDSFGSFVQFLKENSSSINYATIGVGTPPEIVMRQLEKIFGASMTKIAFRSTPLIMQEIVSGRVQLFLSPLLAATPLYEAGKISIVAVTSPTRLAELPEVPTLRENGIELTPFGWLGLCGRTGTPPAVLKRLSTAVVSIVATREYQEMIRRGGATPASSTPDEFRALMTSTMEEAKPLLQQFDLKPRQ